MIEVYPRVYGESNADIRRLPPHVVYPRVYGESGHRMATDVPLRGLSPRVRGIR